MSGICDSLRSPSTPNLASALFFVGSIFLNNYSLRLRKGEKCETPWSKISISQNGAYARRQKEKKKSFCTEFAPALPKLCFQNVSLARCPSNNERRRALYLSRLKPKPGLIIFCSEASLSFLVLVRLRRLARLGRFASIYL